MKSYSKYPFLRGAQALVKKKKIELKELLGDIAYEPARIRGKERLLEAIVSGAIDDKPIMREVDQLAEMLSYPIARMIVSCSADRYLISRYALGEAMLLEKRLLQDDDETLAFIAEELGVKLSKSDKEFMIHFTTYLSATASIRAKEWKLINQEIFGGMVKISRDRLTRVLRQKLNDKIVKELPLPVSDDIISVFKKDALRFSQQLEGKRKKFITGELGPIEDKSFPPCMKTILTMIRSGENVPHSARFAITSFLHTIGMNSQEIMKAFSTAPDFDASKTEYQVRHIIGEISGTEYTPPECSTMKSYGICYNPDDMCEKEWMTHPLKYYRNRRKKKRSGKGAPSTKKSLQGSDVRRDDKEEKQKVEKSKRKA